ncbi:MAG: ATP-dependent 6-phosphofructokinase [Deltaproteobacteria bacterium]|nr:ATP-dependent 6-phosphofructokinase [Deltaproteobacteria bacterium]
MSHPEVVPEALIVDTVGPAELPSPLGLSAVKGDEIADYTTDDRRLPLDPTAPNAASGPRFELAGARERIYFAGPKVNAAIVTCGGLCPGMNNVIRGLVMQLWHAYGVRRILGFRYGYAGLSERREPPWELTPELVKDCHHQGGTILGSSRGPVAAEEMCRTLLELRIDMLFVIGGDGTMRGAHALAQEVSRQGLPIAIVGIPKTIDNDIAFVERTFGYATAVAQASAAITAAHVEATGAKNGIGLVKLMGRHSGYVAASAVLASRDANLVLVPESRFDLDGPAGVLRFIEQRLAARGHAVIVVAEGAGQELIESESTTDRSGNQRLADIGVFLRDALRQALPDAPLKYIDPSYLIRAAPASADDAIFCGQLAEDAVHAAMAGKTGLLIGLWMNRRTHVPLPAVVGRHKRISLDGSFWRNVVETTGQPQLLRSR